MKKITLDYSKAALAIRQEELDNMAGQIRDAHETLTNKTGAGNDFLGWLDLPNAYDKEEYVRIG